MTQIKEYPSYAAYQQQKTRAELEAANRHNLEIRHSEQQIRTMYAKVLAGKGNSADLRDLPTWCVPKAQQADYSEVIAGVAKVWDKFKMR